MFSWYDKEQLDYLPIILTSILDQVVFRVGEELIPIIIPTLEYILAWNPHLCVKTVKRFNFMNNKCKII